MDLYMDQRWFWTGMVLLFGLLLVAVSLIPVLGSLAATLAGPVLAGGMVLAARSQQLGEPLQVSLLFRGWSEYRKDLLLLGVFNLSDGAERVDLPAIPGKTTLKERKNGREVPLAGAIDVLPHCVRLFDVR